MAGIKSRVPVIQKPQN